MSEELYIREGRFHKKVGDIEYDFPTYDGIGYPQGTYSFSQKIKDIRHFAGRSDDVLLATYPKTGTHWVSEILHMLLTGKTNYIEYEFSRDVTFLPNLNALEHHVSPRFLSLHLPYKWFPMSHIKQGGKIVHVTRNPKDTYVSYYHHAVEGLQYGLNTGSMTWNDFFDQCLMTKNLLFGSWFDYEKEMSLAKKSNKNIYTIHYELLKKDPEKEIDGLSKFLGVSLNEQLVKDIAVKCQFQTFKSNLQNREVHPDISKMVANMQRKVPNVYRKGIVGDWKNYFTVAQNELFEEMYEKEMDGYAVKVIY